MTIAVMLFRHSVIYLDILPKNETLVMDCDLAGATAQIERLQKWVFGDYTIRPGKGTGEVKVHVDAAIGLTEWQPGETLKDVVEHSDAVMYKRKEEGRAQHA